MRDTEYQVLELGFPPAGSGKEQRCAWCELFSWSYTLIFVC